MTNIGTGNLNEKVIFEKKNSYDGYDEVDGYKIFLQDEWLFNMNVSQYSCMVTREINDVYSIETNILTDNVVSKTYMTNQFKCLIKADSQFLLLKPSSIMDIHLMPINPLEDPSLPKYYKSFHRVKCKLSQNDSYFYDRIMKIRVAVIDDVYYEYYKSYFNESKYIVSFQKPLFFDKTIPKIQGIANCVHMVNNIDDVRLLRFFDWIEIQRRIGYSKLKFFFFNVTETYRTKIKEFLTENNQDGFIEIVDYRTSLEDLCYWSLQLLKQDPESEINNFLYNNCLKSYKRHFYDIKIENFGMYNSHERIGSNDCFFKYKYTYEFVSNYDFDEIIFPRQVETTNDDLLYNLKEQSCKDYRLNLDLNAYNIYNFITRLSNLYHFKNVSCFHFEHVIFFDDHGLLVEKLLEIYQNANAFKQGFVRYQIANDHIDFNFKKLDTYFLKKFNNFHNIVQCLNETYMKHTKFNYKWNNPYACKMNMRRGKSIFNTNYTKWYYQHHSYVNQPGTFCLDVSINDGFVSHFRDDLDGFLLNQTYPFSVLKFDFEFYLFLIEVSKTYSTINSDQV